MGFWPSQSTLLRRPLLQQVDDAVQEHVGITDRQNLIHSIFVFFLFLLHLLLFNHFGDTQEAHFFSSPHILA